MSAPAPPLDARERLRGRFLAIASHPTGHTFRLLFTQNLPTLALVSLGASEFQVGLQGAFAFAFVALQLPTLRLVGHVSKRSILMSAHVFTLAVALPLVFWDRIGELPQQSAIAIALASFALVGVGTCVGETVWFPLLRAYVEPGQTGRFFGVLRTGWHLTLLAFYAGSQWWLTQHPGAFAQLFALGWGLGAARTFLIAGLPERSERTGVRVRAREALALARDPRTARYLAATSLGKACRVTATVFAIVMLRRAAGLSEGDVVYTTMAFVAGAAVSLYAWGHVVDRVGAVPVLSATATGMALTLLTLALAPASALDVGWTSLWFFTLAFLTAGFEVADTHLLFELTPPEAPARTLVLAAVAAGLAAGLGPLLAGAALDVLLPGDPAGELRTYRGFFMVLALGMASTLVPARGLVSSGSPKTRRPT
jgi:MFS family permease